MSTKLKELREARGKMVADARAILDKATTEKRNLSADEDTSYTALFAKQEELRGQIEREERQVEVERDSAAAALRSRDALRDGQAGRTVDTEARGAHDSDEYRAAFSKLLTQGARSLSEAETRALQADSDTAGGIAVCLQSTSFCFGQGARTLCQQLAERSPIFVRIMRATCFGIDGASSLTITQCVTAPQGGGCRITFDFDLALFALDLTTQFFLLGEQCGIRHVLVRSQIALLGSGFVQKGTCICHHLTACFAEFFEFCAHSVFPFYSAS